MTLWHCAAVASGHIALARECPDAAGRWRCAMFRMDGWKKALSEPNAVGWIAFLILIASIGIGALIFDRPPPRGPAQANFSQLH